MQIRWKRFFLLIALIATTIFILQLMPFISHLLTDFAGGLARHHPRGISPQATVIILVGFVLITFIATLKLILQNKQGTRN